MRRLRAAHRAGEREAVDRRVKHEDRTIHREDRHAGRAVDAGAFFLVKALLSTAFAIPLASIAAALVLAVEAALGVALLGWLFDRFDVSAEQTS